MRSELARVKAELEGEVRTREHRDNRLSLDSQEVRSQVYGSIIGRFMVVSLAGLW